jgi:hypothetical protein
LLGELVIVVAGVAIALAANRTYEEWKDGRVEATYLQRIRTDLQHGATLIGNKARRNAQSRESALRLIDLLEQEAPDEHDVLVSFLYAAQIGGTPAGFRHDATINELMSTGNLNLIDDAELRVDITEYYRRADTFMELDDALPTEALVVFRSLTGRIPERYSMNDFDLANDVKFSDDEHGRIMSELQNGRDHYLRVLRDQASLQQLIESTLADLSELNRSLSARLSSESRP